MAIPFVSRKRLNPRDMDAEGKYYPAPAYISEVDVNHLAQEISYSTTLTPTEIVGVIRSLLQAVPKYMMLGYKVRLDNFGIFKLGLKNKPEFKGHEKPEDVTANDIGGIKVLFTPYVMVQENMSRPEFTKADAKYLKKKTGEEQNPGNDGSQGSQG